MLQARLSLLRLNAIAVQNVDTYLRNVIFSHNLQQIYVAGLDTKRQSAKPNLSTSLRIPRGLLQKIGERTLQTTTVYSLEFNLAVALLLIM